MSAVTTLLQRLETAHRSHPEVMAYCPWPGDIRPGPARYHPHPVEPLLAAETGLSGGPYSELSEAIRAASPYAQWRETYKGTQLFDEIMHRFGCYEIVGVDGFAASQKMRGFMVYMPPGFHYPMHEHPADELYLVLAGAADFQVAGGAKHRVEPGGTVFHACGQPHATTTTDQPVLCYVIWRDHFDTAPVWSAA